MVASADAAAGDVEADRVALPAEDAAPLPTVGHECVPRDGGAAPSECPYPAWTCVARAELADGGDAGAFCTFPCDPSHGGTTQCEVEHFGHCESFADASPVCAK